MPLPPGALARRASMAAGKRPGEPIGAGAAGKSALGKATRR